MADTNTDQEALKAFAERLFNVEHDFADVKAEYTDSKKDLKAEINQRTDETGITYKQVEGLVKVRLNEQKALDEQADMEATMFLYEKVFGFAAPADPVSEDEDDALG
jgi:hypothetical protein